MDEGRKERKARKENNNSIHSCLHCSFEVRKNKGGTEGKKRRKEDN
jgi:hypothetical protein